VRGSGMRCRLLGMPHAALLTPESLHVMLCSLRPAVPAPSELCAPRNHVS